MFHVDDLPTPCLLINRRRLEANLARMQASAHGVSLRPHTKTHKMVRLARRQLELGARGITVAKVSEAEVFVKAGIDDVCIAYTVVGRPQLKRIAALSKQARVAFCVDSPEGARFASSEFSGAPHPIPMLIEVDAGYGRCGVGWEDPALVELARLVGILPGLELSGILTHEGHAYQGDRKQVMANTRDRMLMAAVRLHEAGLADPDRFIISIGSTPSISVFENNTRGGFSITEVRPGNYVFNDLMQVALGVCTMDDCALTVLTTVVSRTRTPSGTERFFLDAGRKVFTADQVSGQSTFGQVLYNARYRVSHPHARLTGLSEEHGWGEVRGGSTFAVGDRVQVVPNHACVVINTQDEVMLVDDDGHCEAITVDARGCVI